MAGADQVVLSYAAGDDRDAAAPHRLLRWAAEHGAETRREPASRLAREASRTDPRSVELGALAEGRSPRGDLEARVAVERARLAFFLDPRMPAAEHTGRVTLGDEVSRVRLVAAVGGDTPARPVAVTAIERAAGCAFAGFARRVLRVRRVDDLSESADNRERGTLVHRALHAAFEAARDAPDALAAAREAAERALGLSSNMAPLRKEAVLSAVDDAVAVVERALAPGTSLRFLAAEQSFGGGARSPAATPAGTPPWDPLPIGGDDHGGALIYVDGQIDRVDASPDRRLARVVDYKTGRLPAADDHGKSAFQLPLYAALVARVLGCEDVEALYVAVKPRGVIDEWPRNDDDRRALGARREEIAGAARRIILRMWDGEVAPRPAKAALCARCEARDVCRRPAVAPIEEAETRFRGRPPIASRSISAPLVRPLRSRRTNATTRGAPHRSGAARLGAGAPRGSVAGCRRFIPSCSGGDASSPCRCRSDRTGTASEARRRCRSCSSSCCCRAALQRSSQPMAAILFTQAQVLSAS